jgi:hypothetical protein
LTSNVLIVRFSKKIFRILLLAGLLVVLFPASQGQSPDQNLPTPVLTNEITGRIPALDLGDARLSRHFYAFEGTPGDLLITIDAKNLNGDMDVFTAVTFRPLVKTTLYANSRAGEVTKGLYLRTRQILILRVEARTPNDEAGTYHIRFGGAFAPFSGGIPVAENNQMAADSAETNRDSRRLSSVGATIAQPVLEKPAVVEPPRETEKPAAETAKTISPKPTRARPNTRNARGRARPTRPKPAPSETVQPSEVKTDAEPTKSEPAVKPQELPLAGAHLIIESKDGTKIDRPMSTVRRVVVEGGMIVVVLRTGRIERIPMSGVARMAIEP